MQRRLRSHAEPILITPLHLHELHNAIGLCQFWGHLTSTRAADVVQQVARDARDGKLVSVIPPWAEVYAAGQRLIAEHTPLLGAHDFCGFDERQSKLARAAGLKLRLAA